MHGVEFGSSLRDGRTTGRGAGFFAFACIVTVRSLVGSTPVDSCGRSTFAGTTSTNAAALSGATNRPDRIATDIVHVPFVLSDQRSLKQAISGS